MRGQTSMEAAMLFTFMIAALTIFMLAMGNQYTDIQQTKTKAKLNDVAQLVQVELQLGASAQNGYERTFEIPAKAGGINFALTMYNSSRLGSGSPANFTEVGFSFEGTSLDYATFIFLPENIDGGVRHGRVHLRKQNGTLYVINSS